MAQPPHRPQPPVQPARTEHRPAAAHESADQGERAAKGEGAVGSERAASTESAEREERAAGHASAEIPERAGSHESAEERERAEQRESADVEERDVDAPPLPQVLAMSLQSVVDDENPDGADPELCCAVINLPLDCDGPNLAGRQKVQLVLARDPTELQARGLSALISEYRMAQTDAEAAWSAVVWLQPPAASVMREVVENHRPAMRA